MQTEIEQGQQDPRVKLSLLLPIVTDTNNKVTHVNPFGALVQMYQPFKMPNATWVAPCMFAPDRYEVERRVCDILGMSMQHYVALMRHVFYGLPCNLAGMSQRLRELR